MQMPTRSDLLKFSVKILIGIVVGGFWYHLIVPFLFYITFADTEMKEQMEGDLWELHGIAYTTTQELVNEGISLD